MNEDARYARELALKMLEEQLKHCPPKHQRAAGCLRMVVIELIKAGDERDAVRCAMLAAALCDENVLRIYDKVVRLVGEAAQGRQVIIEAQIIRSGKKPADANDSEETD